MTARRKTKAATSTATLRPNTRWASIMRLDRALGAELSLALEYELDQAVALALGQLQELASAAIRLHAHVGDPLVGADHANAGHQAAGLARERELRQRDAAVRQRVL